MPQKNYLTFNSMTRPRQSVSEENTTDTTTRETVMQTCRTWPY